jgi:hypothetical protein
MYYLKILSAIVIASSAFISCRNSKSKELTVPTDASTVVLIKGASINSKASWNDLMKADWFRREKEMSADSFDKQLLEDPENSGVDLKSDLIYFSHRKDFTTYSVIEGKLKDASDFEKFLSHKNSGKKTEDAGDFNFMLIDKSDIITWSNSKFIYISGEQSIGPGTSVPIDSLKTYASSLFDLKKENSIESNENYSSLLKETGDIYFWSKTADALSNFQFGPLPVIAASAMMQGSITAGTINFENGKVVIKSKQYLNATLSKLIQNYASRPLSSDVLSHVSPGASIVIAMSYDPQLIKDFLKVSGTESTTNKFLEDYGLKLDDLLHASKGQILMTASELGPQATSENDEMADDIFPFGGNLLFAASANNDSTFKKLGTAIKQVFPTAINQLQNNWFLVGSSTATVNQFFSAGSNSIVSEKLNGHPLGIYIDIQKGLQQWNVHGLDSSLLQQIELSKSFWGDIVSVGGEFKNGSVNFETNINLADKSTNSLRQFAKYSEQMSKLITKDEYVNNRSFQKNPFLSYNF